MNEHDEILNEMASALEMLIFCKGYKDSYGKYDGVYDKVAPAAWDKAKTAIEKYKRTQLKTKKTMNENEQIVIKNAPEKIYLQVGYENDLDAEHDFSEFDTENISWCADRIYDTDLEYALSSIIKEKDEQINPEWKDKFYAAWSKWFIGRGHYTEVEKWIEENIVNQTVK